MILVCDKFVSLFLGALTRIPFRSVTWWAQLVVGAVIEVYQTDLYGANDAELWDDKDYETWFCKPDKPEPAKQIRIDQIEFLAPPGGLSVTLPHISISYVTKTPK